MRYDEALLYWTVLSLGNQKTTIYAKLYGITHGSRLECAFYFFLEVDGGWVGLGVPHLGYIDDWLLN